MASKGTKIGLIILGIILVLAIAIVILLWKVGFFASPELSVDERGPYQYVYVQRTGPFSEIPQGFKQADSLVKQQGIDVGIECGAYLDNPAQVAQDDLRWRTGYIVEDSVQTRAPLEFETIVRQQYLVGSIDAIPMVAIIKIYPLMQEWLTKNAYTVTGPAYELYNENGVVEVLFPISKGTQ
ncbi:MAG: GyrI-like domain-containing protein [Calditrichaceae bacterium]